MVKQSGRRINDKEEKNGAKVIASNLLHFQLIRNIFRLNKMLNAAGYLFSVIMMMIADYIMDTGGGNLRWFAFRYDFTFNFHNDNNNKNS